VSLCNHVDIILFAEVLIVPAVRSITTQSLFCAPHLVKLMCALV
jgi:hypothetical protein